jgi:hypothetical protein
MDEPALIFEISLFNEAVRLGCASFGAPFKDTWNGIRDRLNKSFLQALDTPAPQRHHLPAVVVDDTGALAMPSGNTPSAALTSAVSLPQEAPSQNQPPTVHTGVGIHLVSDSVFLKHDVSHKAPTDFTGLAVDHGIKPNAFYDARKCPLPPIN